MKSGSTIILFVNRKARTVVTDPTAISTVDDLEQALEERLEAGEVMGLSLVLDIRNMHEASMSPAELRRWRFYAEALNEQAIEILDAIDGDPDLEDGGDEEPSFASPTGGDSHLC